MSCNSCNIFFSSSYPISWNKWVDTYDLPVILSTACFNKIIRGKMIPIELTLKGIYSYQKEQELITVVSWRCWSLLMEFTTSTVFVPHRYDQWFGECRSESFLSDSGGCGWYGRAVQPGGRVWFCDCARQLGARLKAEGWRLTTKKVFSYWKRA